MLHTVRGRECKGQTWNRHKRGQDEAPTQTAEQEGTVKRRKEKRSKGVGWALTAPLPQKGGDGSSHAPVVRLKNVGLLHSLQPGKTTLGCLVGKRACYRPVSSQPPLPPKPQPPPSSRTTSSSTSPFYTWQASAFCLPH